LLFELSQINKLVFSNPSYVILASVIFVGLLFPLLIISEFIFLEPYLIFHVSYDRISGFVLIVAVSALSGIVLSMNVFRIKKLRSGVKKMGGGFFGSIVGASAGACSCGPIGFAVISTFGTVGGIATSFLTNYEIPLRLVALGILGFTYFTTRKALVAECKMKN